MNKQTLLNHIAVYNSKKGCRRKFLPFFPPFSKEMQKLITFTRPLLNGGFLLESEVIKLQSILEKKLFRGKDLVADGTATSEIFKKIYDEMREDVVIAKMKKVKWRESILISSEKLSQNFI